MWLDAAQVHLAQGALGAVAVSANGLVLLLFATVAGLRTQPNTLLANMSLCNCMLGLSAVGAACAHATAAPHSDTDACRALCVFNAWSRALSLCSVVPVSHFRIKVIKTYDDSHQLWLPASVNVMRASLSLKWLLCTLAAVCALLLHESAPSPTSFVFIKRCSLVSALRLQHLLPYVLFTTTVVQIVCVDLCYVLYAMIAPRLSATSKRWHTYVEFNRRTGYTLLAIGAAFALCHVPVQIDLLSATYDSIRGEHAAAPTYVAALPALHAALAPIMYPLSDADFRLAMWALWRRLGNARRRQQAVGRQLALKRRTPPALRGRTGGRRTDSTEPGPSDMVVYGMDLPDMTWSPDDLANMRNYNLAGGDRRPADSKCNGAAAGARRQKAVAAAAAMHGHDKAACRKPPPRVDAQPDAVRKVAATRRAVGAGGGLRRCYVLPAVAGPPPQPQAHWRRNAELEISDRGEVAYANPAYYSLSDTEWSGTSSADVPTRCTGSSTGTGSGYTADTESLRQCHRRDDADRERAEWTNLAIRPMNFRQKAIVRNDGRKVAAASAYSNRCFDCDDAAMW